MAKRATARAKPPAVRRGKSKGRKRLKARSSTASTTRKTAPRPKTARKSAARKRLAKRAAARGESVPTPPSSLDMRRGSSAARTGRHELRASLHDHGAMTPTITGGDVDADWENAYFSGDEAPGGDNPTPDQDVVDDIGKALGVQYDDNEELKAADKVVERDKHRWELDPASAEDYKEHK